MKVATLKSVLECNAADTKVVIRIQRPGSIGGTPCVEVESVHAGFDWDSGKLLIYPAQPLTALTPEQLEEIHESLKQGQSWHANEAYRKLRQKCDSFRVDAERHRFGREFMINTKLQEDLAPWLEDFVNTPEPTTAEEHDRQADHLIAVARAAGLWPIKTEGEAA